VSFSKGVAVGMELPVVFFTASILHPRPQRETERWRKKQAEFASFGILVGGV